MQEEMGMAVVSRVFPGGQQGDLALSCLLLCPYEGVRALKCHLRLLEVTTCCPWLTISLAKCEQIGAVISLSPWGQGQLGRVQSQMEKDISP